MEFSNWYELEYALKEKMRLAMNATRQRAFDELNINTHDFYEGTEPKVYHRLGLYGQSPHWSADSTSFGSSDGAELSVEIWMDGNYQYYTGCHPTGYEVFQWAEEHSHRILGKASVWERTMKAYPKIIRTQFGKYFKPL